MTSDERAFLAFGIALLFIIYACMALAVVAVVTQDPSTIVNAIYSS